jgi:uncharacterized membrane protein (DUF4010 family)
LLKKFVFPKSGILLTGILGGLYSSTATTVILARKSKESPGDQRISAAIILATTMMYLRIFLLAVFFNKNLAVHLAPAFAVLVAASSLLALYFSRHTANKRSSSDPTEAGTTHSNPLEFKTSLIFGTLFI